MSDRDATEALRWITGVLTRVHVPFQAVGGLAARAYGATRPLLDLDFYIPGSGFPGALAEVADYRTWGPAHFRNDAWDLTFAKIERAGVPIELGQAEGARYYDRSARRWVDQAIDFDRSEWRRVLGVTVPVMPKAQLLAYKRALGRPVDHADLEEIGD